MKHQGIEVNKEKKSNDDFVGMYIQEKQLYSY